MIMNITLSVAYRRPLNCGQQNVRTTRSTCITLRMLSSSSSCTSSVFRPVHTNSSKTRHNTSKHRSLSLDGQKTNWKFIHATGTSQWSVFVQNVELRTRWRCGWNSFDAQAGGLFLSLYPCVYALRFTWVVNSKERKAMSCDMPRCIDLATRHVVWNQQVICGGRYSEFSMKLTSLGFNSTLEKPFTGEFRFFSMIRATIECRNT